ncbi:type II toxin-antitoxin system RelE/ParE family toxin [Bosea vaviloviae]|uniref:Toxin n=1 Tax=Bosea vaviloviae TaxID=1526658 RepID=A0A1D7TWL4_9HYPH|nr:type II toxin-antitoxin system RelE/ParE family toxin [Bosea vaviloviae]AOO79524.1 plasmid stabilization protein ParE [Bosea vaviloviae]
MSGRRGGYWLSPLAEADLEEIWLYSFREWSADQADKYHNDIVSAFDGIAAGTKKGRPVDIREGYFKYAVGSHVFYYKQVDTGEIIIIRILHQRMDANRHL